MKFIIAVLALSIAGYGQTAEQMKQQTMTLPQPVKPLACEKYQHEVLPRGHHNCRVVESSMGNLMQCEDDPPKCEDDMHMVTEREWQELMERLRVLEEVAHFVLRIKTDVNGEAK